mmetsp:Transcript_88011/g.139870  ORF Transcript_88011/g.139870 Transcript_88011/m.139870 type:complete len:125 (-) Transcript_88011:768-1142(-)
MMLLLVLRDQLVQFVNARHMPCYIVFADMRLASNAGKLQWKHSYIGAWKTLHLLQRNHGTAIVHVPGLYILWAWSFLAQYIFMRKNFRISCIWSKDAPFLVETKVPNAQYAVRFLWPYFVVLKM